MVQDGKEMNATFLIALGFYLLLFIIIAVLDIRKVKSFSDYGVAGKSQGTFAVTMTLLATVLGASTTIGIADTVYQIGFPGIWWLIFGALGLLLQSFILSEKVRETNADTLPELLRRLQDLPRDPEGRGLGLRGPQGHGRYGRCRGLQSESPESEPPDNARLPRERRHLLPEQRSLEPVL